MKPGEAFGHWGRSENVAGLEKIGEIIPAPEPGMSRCLRKGRKLVKGARRGVQMRTRGLETASPCGPYLAMKSGDTKMGVPANLPSPSPHQA